MEARAEVGVGSQDLQKGVSQTTVGTMSRFGGKAGQFVQSLTVILKNLTCVPQEATKWHDQYFYRQTRSMGGFPPPSSLLMLLFPSPAINSLKIQLGNFMICLILIPQQRRCRRDVSSGRCTQLGLVNALTAVVSHCGQKR